MQALLQCWKPLQPVAALELLDFAYADSNVRQFAINCLKDIRCALTTHYLHVDVYCKHVQYFMSVTFR